MEYARLHAMLGNAQAFESDAVAELDTAMGHYLLSLLGRPDPGVVRGLRYAFERRMGLTPEERREGVARLLRPVLIVLRSLAEWGAPEPDPRSVFLALNGVDEESGGALDDGTEDEWSPDPELFDAVRVEWHRALPAEDLVALVQEEFWAQDPYLLMEALRAVLAQDAILPALRAHLLVMTAERLLSVHCGSALDWQEELLAALEVALELHEPGERAIPLHLLSVAHAERILGDHAAEMERAIDYATAALAQAPDEVAMRAQLGQLYRDRRLGDPRGNLAEAERLLASTVDDWGPAGEPYLWARAMNSLGLTRLELGRLGRPTGFEEAAAGFREALTVLTRDAHAYEWAGTTANLGAALSAADALDEAIACFRDALGIERSAPETAETRHNLAQALRASGRLDEAAEEFAEVLAVHDAATFPFEHRRSAGALGEILAGRGEWERAHEVFDSGGRAEDRLLAAAGGDARLIDDVVREGHQIGELDAYALTELGRAAEAVAAVERGRARSLAEAVRPRRTEPEPEVLRYRRARAAWVAAQLAVDAPPEGNDYAERLARAAALGRAAREARHEFAEALEGLYGSDAPAPEPEEETPVEVPLVYLFSTPWGGRAILTRPGDEPSVLAIPALTDDVATGLGQTLHQGTLIGGYFAAQDGLGPRLLAARPGVSFADKAATLPEGTLSAAARAVLAMAHPGLPESTLAPYSDLEPAARSRLDTTLGHEFLRAELARCLPALAETVMGPLVAWLRASDVDAAALVACGALPAFPLLAAAPPGVAFTIAPSARAVAGSSETTREGVYTLGDPRPTHLPLRWGEAEALTVAALAGDATRARVGEEATRAWLLESLREGHTVVASCHGEFDAWNVFASRLFLARGETLTLDDVLGEAADLSGLRLLVLSACQTAVMDIRRGALGEARGLATGMLQAGARAVLASLWPVDDRATYLLIVRFMREWLPGNGSPSAALARAQAWLREATYAELAGLDEGPAAVRGRGFRYGAQEAAHLAAALAGRRAEVDPEGRPYADPVHWAGFQVFGL
ncbi:hypothetical protein Afil01_43730 [Actinorhabdospora filicis]|uniref:CHAT domain-containing protein n=1 Tax=Actinorhabdospora filicis TaxID=1785913 RepID=A0A9W6WBH2_9ACTN|nr:hypothetical protein Afil01_43730 [Actinorhabdospora filicis]